MKEISKGVDDLFYDKLFSKSSGHLVDSHPLLASVKPSDKIIFDGCLPVCGALLYSPGRMI